MGVLSGIPRAAGAHELLDSPASLPEVEANLRDLARLNRLFGGAWLIRAQVAGLLDAVRAGRPLTILDVGTGGADLPVALVRWARRSGRPIRVFALDSNAQFLELACRLATRYPEIVFIRGDGLSLPLKAEAVDVALA
ncbi:MAG: methyltransferase domain-containing protein [Candidatus Methylomirabilia bacterium]